MTARRLLPPSLRAVVLAGLTAAGALALAACGGSPAAPASSPGASSPTTSAGASTSSAAPSSGTSTASPSASVSSGTAAASSTAASTTPAGSAAASATGAASPTGTAAPTAAGTSPAGSPAATGAGTGTSAGAGASTGAAASTPAAGTAPSTTAGAVQGGSALSSWQARAGSGSHGRTDCTVKACVALTFDDGPNPSTTQQVLDALDARGAKGTFFVIGERAADYPSVLARMAEGGHEIGNHTYTHVNLTGEDWAGMTAELKDTQAVVKAATGKSPTLVRPPWGETNAAVKQAIAATGESPVLWNVDTMDWYHQKPEYVTGADVERDDVVLMHDIYPSTSGAVGELVDRLQAQGFTLVTVSDLRDG